MIAKNNQPTISKWIIWLVIIVVLASLATTTPSTTRSSSILKKLKGNAKARATAMKENVKARATAVKENLKKLGDNIGKTVKKAKGKLRPTTPTPERGNHPENPQGRNFFAIVHVRYKTKTLDFETLECAGTVVADDEVLTAGTCFEERATDPKNGIDDFKGLHVTDVAVFVGEKEVSVDYVDIYRGKKTPMDFARVKVPSNSFQDKIQICAPIFWNPVMQFYYYKSRLTMVGLSCDGVDTGSLSKIKMNWQEVEMNINDTTMRMNQPTSCREDSFRMENMYCVPTMEFLPDHAGHKSISKRCGGNLKCDRLCENRGGPVFSTYKSGKSAYCLVGVVKEVVDNQEWFHKSKNWQSGIVFTSLEKLHLALKPTASETSDGRGTLLIPPAYYRIYDKNY